MTKIGWINFISDIFFMYIVLLILPFHFHYPLRMTLFYAFIQLMVGRYRNNVLLYWDELRLIIISHLWFLASSLLFMDVLDLWNWIQIIGLDLILFLFNMLFARYSHIWFRPFLKKNVLVIGIGHTAQKLGGTIRSNRFSLMDVIGYIDCNNSNLLPNIYQQDNIVQENVYSLDVINKVIQKENIKCVIIAIPQIIEDDLKTVMNLVRDQVNEIKVLPRFENLVTFDSRIDDFDSLLMIATAQRTISLPCRILKRLIDIIGGIFGCLACIPLYCFVKYKNHKSGDYDPILFKQKRIGKNGKEFTIYKFRTMIPNAEKKLEELMDNDPKIKSEYMKNKKLKNDPRITDAGKFLRRTSLDEFPQFINVLKGEMSLIGPRPYLPGEKTDMGSYYDIIIKSKPGLTGMWQTHGRSDVDFNDRLELDEYYYRNYSLWLDVTLLVKTAKTILAGKGEGAV